MKRKLVNVKVSKIEPYQTVFFVFLDVTSIIRKLSHNFTSRSFPFLLFVLGLIHVVFENKPNIKLARQVLLYLSFHAH